MNLFMASTLLLMFHVLMFYVPLVLTKIVIFDICLILLFLKYCYIITIMTGRVGIEKSPNQTYIKV